MCESLLSESKLGVFYSSAKPYLIRWGAYDFLMGQEGYWDFQKRLMSLSETPLGMELALCLLVEVNASGTLISEKNQLLNRLVTGEIFALAVSEKGWANRLKNIKSRRVNQRISGEKSFITNGAEADCILLVVKDDNRYPVFLLPKRELPMGKLQTTIFCKRVSHWSVSLEEVPVADDAFVCADYLPYGRKIQKKELYSIVSLLLGKTKSLSAKSPKLKQAWEDLYSWSFGIASKANSGSWDEVFSREVSPPTDDFLEQLLFYYGHTQLTQLFLFDPEYALFFRDESNTMP